MKIPGASFWGTSLRGIKIVCYAVYTLFLCVSLFFNGTAVCTADSGEYIHLKITYPADGAIVTSDSFDVTLTYDITWGTKYKQQTGEQLYRNVLYQVFDTSGNILTTVDKHDMIPVPGKGSITFRGGLPWESLIINTPRPGTYILAVWVDFSGTGKYYSDGRSEETSIKINYQYPPTSSPATSPATSPAISPTPPPTVAPGAIYIKSDPGDAEIYMDGVYRVNTNFGPTYVPFTDLKPGLYRIFIRKDGYLNYDKTVEVESNQIYDVDAVLKPGIPVDGLLQINSDPIGARVFIGSKEYSPTPHTFMDIRPGTYEVTLKKEGYEDWTDTVTVIAGKNTVVEATLPRSSGFPIVPVAGGAAAVAGAGGLIKLITSKRKPAVNTGAIMPKTTNNPYTDWWNKTKPADRNWESFNTYMKGKMGQPPGGYEDLNGNPSWSSAWESYQKELKNGQTKSEFGDWVNQHRAQQNQFKQMQEAADKMPQRSQEIIDAEKKYKDALDNLEAQKQVQKVVDYVIKDKDLVEFYNKAEHTIVDDNGKVDIAKLNQMKGIIKNWEVQKQFRVEPPDYTYLNAVKDTASTVGYIVVRGAAAYFTGGLSEVGFVSYTAIDQVKQSMIAGKSDTEAWKDGVKAGTFDLLTGEVMGRGLGKIGGWAKTNKTLNRPITSFFKSESGSSVSAATKTVKLSQSNPKLADDMKKFQDKMQGEDMGNYNKDRIMNERKVVEVDKTPELKLDENEKNALDNYLKYGGEIKNNAKLLPQEYKNVLSSAKQKIFENAQVAGTKNAVSTMGANAKGKTFVGQTTGSAAKEGNAAYDPAFSDNDHTVNFGDKELNIKYKEGFDQYIKEQGYDPEKLHMNTYGEGIPNSDAYTGTGKQWVDHYNQTAGVDNMVQVNSEGKITISRQTPTKIQSLVSKDTDVADLNRNFTDSFANKLNEAGDLSNPQKLDQILKSGSKEVSRTAGKYGGNSIKYFQENGTITNYQPPPAAKVADLVKNNNMDIDTAMKQAGYSGSKQQLLADYKKLLNIGGI